MRWPKRQKAHVNNRTKKDENTLNKQISCEKQVNIQLNNNYRFDS